MDTTSMRFQAIRPGRAGKFFLLLVKHFTMVGPCGAAARVCCSPFQNEKDTSEKDQSRPARGRCCRQRQYGYGFPCIERKPAGCARYPKVGLARGQETWSGSFCSEQDEDVSLPPQQPCDAARVPLQNPKRGRGSLRSERMGHGVPIVQVLAPSSVD